MKDLIFEIRRRIRTKNITVAALLRKDGTLIDIVGAGDESELRKVITSRKPSEVVIVDITTEPVTRERALELVKKYPRYKIYIISQQKATNYTVAEVKLEVKITA